MQVTPTSSISSDMQRIADLAQDAARHAEELLRAEFAVAKHELREDIQSMKKRAVSIAAAVLLINVAFVMLALGLVLWLGATPAAAFGTGGVLAVLAVVGAIYGIRASGKNTITVARDELKRDINAMAGGASNEQQH
jgi:uncharacterized membrane protein YqjE